MHRYCPQCGAANIGRHSNCLLCHSDLPGVPFGNTDRGEDITVINHDDRFEAPTVLTPKSSPLAYIIYTTGPSTGQKVQLQKSLSLGRSRESDVLIDSEEASRSHAIVSSTQDGCWQITDLNSTNGTYVNQVRITQPVRLRNGNRIQIGDIELLVRTGQIQEKNCLYCGKPIPTELVTKFCRHCGQPIQN